MSPGLITAWAGLWREGNCRRTRAAYFRSAQEPSRTAAVTGERFAIPFAIRTPEGAEGWQGMYPYYALLSEERAEDGKFDPEGLHVVEDGDILVWTNSPPHSCITMLNTN